MSQMRNWKFWVPSKGNVFKSYFSLFAYVCYIGIEFTYYRQMNRSWMSKIEDQKTMRMGLKILFHLQFKILQIKTPSNAHVYNVEIWYSILLKRLENIYSFMELTKVTILSFDMGRLLYVVDHQLQGLNALIEFILVMWII